MTNIDMQNYFDCNLKTLDEEAVIYLNQYDPGPINNVLVGINEFCAGMMQFTDAEEFKFELFYVNNEQGVKGYVLSLDLSHEFRNEILACFSRLIFEEFSCHIGVTEVFNTYQYSIKTILEKKEIFTLSNDMLNTNNEFWLKNVRGVTATPSLNELDIARHIFKDQQIPFDDCDENKIYLKHNPRNGLTKIGRSKSPSLRERTLKGEDPETEFIAIWKAPRKVERELHEKFSNKKERGEWFRLNHQDFNLIKAEMSCWT